MILKNPFDLSEYSNCQSGYQYALDVYSGKEIACKYVIGACTRFLKDYARTLEDEKYPYYFDVDRAERYLRLVQKFNHVKGHWKVANIVYEPWQNFIFMNIRGFFWRNEIFPRFRIAHVEVSRGNAKSAMASQSALFDLALDDPKGNEISCFANKSEQARIVLDSARAMARENKKYLASTGVEVLAHKVIHAKSNSVLRAMSSEDKSLDGLNDKLAILDELHVMSRELFDVISSGMSKRRDSLMLCITTAGNSTDSVGYSQSVYAKKVCMGEVQDDQMFAIVYTVDEGDDIFSEVAWKKANPNYGVSVDPITFAAKAEKAKISPSDLPNFKIKHLDIWISEAKAYYDILQWDKCYDPKLTWEFFKGRKTYAAIDLSSKIDLTSKIYVTREMIEQVDGTFISHYYVWDKSYIPEKTVEEKNLDIYRDGISKGHLIATTGEAIHYPKIEKEFEEMCQHVNLLAAFFDPWNATQFAQNMLEKNYNMTEFRMNTANLSEPTKQIDALMRQGRIHHNGSVILRWCLSNVVCREDAAGNVFPKKSHEKLKIDAAIAFIMAMAGWIQEKEDSSVYEDRGFLVI